MTEEPKPAPLSRRDALRLGAATAAGVVVAKGCSPSEPLSQGKNMLSASSSLESKPRKIIHKTRGNGGGVVTRLMSPSDLGRLLKPFVFLDIFNVPAGPSPMNLETGWHPHSGIATVTVIFDGSGRYAETTGNTGTLPTGGVEWMQAGGGVWHTGEMNPEAAVKGFQLWVALPKDRENAPSSSVYLGPTEVPRKGPARVVLGGVGDAVSPIESPPMNYLAVELRDGERWAYEPPPGHNVAWVSVLDGKLNASGPVSGGELALFEESDDALEFGAQGDTRFVLGSAPKHPHELFLGSYSVHTSADALRQGEVEIRRIGRELSAQGKRSYALQHYG